MFQQVNFIPARTALFAGKDKEQRRWVVAYFRCEDGTG